MKKLFFEKLLVLVVFCSALVFFASGCVNDEGKIGVANDDLTAASDGDTVLKNDTGEMAQNDNSTTNVNDKDAYPAIDESGEVNDADQANQGSCGNKVVDSGEICDGTTKQCSEINPNSYSSGTANCNAQCSDFDLSSCVSKSVCGNSVKELGEICDTGSVQCNALDSTLTGTAVCLTNCLGYDQTTCTKTVETKVVYTVNSAKCNGCGHCFNSCSVGALKKSGNKAVIDPELCNGCGDCAKRCGRGAITKVQ